MRVISRITSGLFLITASDIVNGLFLEIRSTKLIPMDHFRLLHRLFTTIYVIQLRKYKDITKIQDMTTGRYYTFCDDICLSATTGKIDDSWTECY